MATLRDAKTHSREEHQQGSDESVATFQTKAHAFAPLPQLPRSQPSPQTAWGTLVTSSPSHIGTAPTGAAPFHADRHGRLPRLERTRPWSCLPLFVTRWRRKFWQPAPPPLFLPCCRRQAALTTTHFLKAFLGRGCGGTGPAAAPREGMAGVRQPPASPLTNPAVCGGYPSHTCLERSAHPSPL